MYAVKLLPSGATNSVDGLVEGHKLAREMVVCDGVEAVEVLYQVDGEWKLSVRYTPEEFDADGNFIEEPSARKSR